MGHKKHCHRDMMNARARRKEEHGDAFAYDRYARTHNVREVHAALNPAHGGVRHVHGDEFVSVLFDVTGSYATVPRVVQSDLPELYSRLVINKWVPANLNVQVGAVGDVYSDIAPLQLSQAEADGATVDQWLAQLYLEGGGGGGNHESYELAFWALANQNYFSGWQKGKKANAFIIFDEKTYDRVSVDALRRMYTSYSSKTVTDDGVQMSQKMLRKSLEAGEDSVVLPDVDIRLDDMASQLRSRYDVWAIMIKGTGYWGRQDNLSHWRGMLGAQSVIELEHPENVSELISGLMGAKYAAVSHNAITRVLETSIMGTGDIARIERAMSDVPALPSTVDFKADQNVLGGGLGKDVTLYGDTDGVDRL